MRCLEKQPEQRFEKPMELLDALEGSYQEPAVSPAACTSSRPNQPAALRPPLLTDARSIHSQPEAACFRKACHAAHQPNTAACSKARLGAAKPWSRLPLKPASSRTRQPKTGCARVARPASLQSPKPPTPERPVSPPASPKPIVPEWTAQPPRSQNRLRRKARTATGESQTGCAGVDCTTALDLKTVRARKACASTGESKTGCAGVDCATAFDLKTVCT